MVRVVTYLDSHIIVTGSVEVVIRPGCERSLVVG